MTSTPSAVAGGHTQDGELNLPWAAKQIGISGLRNEFNVCVVRDASGNPVIDAVLEPEASAIVRAVNCHDELVRVVKLVLAGLQSGSVKAKPLLDFSNPNAESLKLESLDEILIAALKATGGAG